MSRIAIRKRLLNIETVYHEGGPVASTPLRIGIVAIVIANPLAGRFAEAEALIAFGKDARAAADELVPELISALGGTERIQAYGKGAIVGSDGELEHGAIWHEAGGYAMRAKLPTAKSIVPANK